MIFYALIAFSIAEFGLRVTEESMLRVKTVTGCKRNSIDYSICLKNAVQESWPRLVKGLPEFDLPSLDPLFYEYGKSIFDTGMIHGEVILSNSTVIGLTTVNFLNVRTHFLDDVFRLEIDVQIPWIFINGSAGTEGTIGGFRMGGKGHFNMSVEDVRGTGDMIGHVINDTWIVKHFHIAPSVAKVKFYSADFFGGNKEFNNLVADFVNEYWPPLYRVMLPIVSKNWDPWVTGLVNRVLSKISFSKLFLEN